MRGKRTFGRGAAAAAITILLAAPAGMGQDIQGGEVNIAGATLFSDFFLSPASTNDFIDVDGDGTFGFDPNRPPFVDQLAPLWQCQGWSGWWLVQYRGVGSVNGLGEFVDYQLLGTFTYTIPSEKGYLNRLRYADSGQGIAHGCNCNSHGQDPACCGSNTPYCPSTIDLGVLDVPTSWAVVAGSAQRGAWNRSPTSDGYGYNPVPSNTGWISELQSLSRVDGQGNVISLNTNINNPDENTVFDTQIAWVPIVYLANRGAGVQRLRMTELHHLFVSGRLPSGENLVAATRSVGSGTRNGIMNTSGIDPAWGRGDNIGDELINGTFANLGPRHQPTNCQSSSVVETAIQNRRLAVGYTGLAGPSRAASDALAGRYEIIDVMFDDRGGAQYVRPTIDSVLDICDPSTGYQLGGPETFTSRGDPEITDPDHPAYMESQAAADYLRNIVASILAFKGNPPSEENFNMPGELLALTFFLLNGEDCLPLADDPTSFVANPNLNQILQEFIRDNNGLGIGQDTPPFGSVNIAGLTPKRNADPDFDGDGTIDGYSDGSFNGDYLDADGNLVRAGIALSERNQISGDFNNDGARNIDDVDRLMLALSDPRAFEAGIDHGGDTGQMAGDYVIVEVIGDFDGDGNFDARDVRYFADGLAVDPTSRTLHRREGFTRVDVAWAGITGDDNYFGTALATPKDYDPGDSRGDVAGSPEGSNPGGLPSGADGLIDARDIDYVCANFGDWSDLDQAVFIDLSADLNGDLRIDRADVDELVQTILGTRYGDVNLDGVVDQTDLGIVIAHRGQQGGWAEGDMNCDGLIDALDEQIVRDNMGGCNPCDMNCDGAVNATDIQGFIGRLFGDDDPCCGSRGQPGHSGDTNGDGAVNAGDIQGFIDCLFG